MPLVSSTALANHKGGCGKTTQLFQVACEYAAANPTTKVAVFDSTTLGDVSKLFLGGNVGARGKTNLAACADKGHTFTAVLAAALEAGTKSPGLTSPGVISGMFNRLRMSAGGGPAPPVVDLEDLLVQVSTLNPAVPANLWLACGGPNKDSQMPLDAEQCTACARVVRDSMAAANEPWKALFDTDGDLTFAPYTQVALRASDAAVLPLKPCFNDFDRVETFLEELHPLNGAKVLLIMWNEIDATKYAPCPPLSNLLTPSKAAQEVIHEHNKFVAEVARGYPTLFVHPIAEQGCDDDFFAASSMLMQSFGVIGVASAEHGIPFCSLEKGKLEGGRMAYAVDGEKLERLRANVRELADRI